jgi:uncharacterized protein (TIGR03435 family)
MTPDQLTRGLIVQAKGRNFVMTVKGMTLDFFVDALGAQKETAGKQVVNQTGLTGAYDFTLTWGPEDSAAVDSGDANEVIEPPLFTAIQQQLGLKLAEGKGPAEVVVIDHIEKPVFDEAEVTAPAAAAVTAAATAQQPPSLVPVALIQEKAAKDSPAAKPLALDQSSPTYSPTPATQPATTVTKPITFEVATVRRNNTGTYGGHGPTADGYDQKNLLPVTYLNIAFQIMEAQRIQGLPDWCMTDKYDINAKVAESDIPEWREHSAAEFHTALQALLVDRFHLKFHFETRDAPAYALVVAKNGPKFKAATPDETYPDGFHDRAGKPLLGLGNKDDPGSGHGRLIAQAATMAQLAQLMSTMMNQVLGRQVVDKTGLAGAYDFSMSTYTEWVSSHQTDDSTPSIFTTLEESLGLKLEPTKTQIEYLVIDHIERPSEN